MLEAVTDELHLAKRALEEIARWEEKRARYFFSSVLLLQWIIKVS